MTPARELLGAATGRLRAAGVASPRHDAEALLAHVLGVARSALGLVDDVPDDGRGRFAGLVDRRAGREPLQHLLGTAAFRYVEVAVGPGVFVPRPETEVVAGWLVEALSAVPNPLAVDLGTGSGAIAKSLAAELPSARVCAVEIDPPAYAAAQGNLAGTGVRLELADLADALGDLDGTVDGVVSNPPYIPLDAYESVEPEVADHDPPAALWSGPDGLDAIRAVERAAARLLRPGGVVACEHADLQGESAPAVFAGSGAWCEVRDHPDLAGRPRFVTARRLAPRRR